MGVVEGDLLEELPVVLDVIHTLSSSTGILLSGSTQEFDYHGDIEESLIVDPNSIVSASCDTYYQIL